MKQIKCILRRTFAAGMSISQKFQLSFIYSLIYISGIHENYARITKFKKSHIYTFHIFKGDKTTVVQVSDVAHKRTSYC